MTSRKQLKKVAKNTFVLQESSSKFSEKKIQEAYSQIAEIKHQIAIAKEAINKANEIAKQNGIDLNISFFDNPDQEDDEWYDSWSESDGEDSIPF